MLSDSELRELQERVKPADANSSAITRAERADMVTLLRAVGEYRELIECCIEAFEDGIAPNNADVLLKALKVSLNPTRARLLCRVCGKPPSEHANPQFGICTEPTASR